MAQTATRARSGISVRDSAIARILLLALETPADVAAGQVAACLARQHRAALAIVRVVSLPPTAARGLVPDLGVGAGAGPHADFYGDALRTQLQGQGLTITTQLVEAIGATATATAARQLRQADLAVLGRPAGDLSACRTAALRFSTSLLESGRPLLVVPPGFEIATSPLRRILIAWSSSPQAMRAVNDALPVLAGAARVDVLMVDPVANGVERTGEFGAGVAAHLQRHGVACNLAVERSAGRPTGQTILAWAARSGSQMIIAGGYGHARVRRWTLGSTTRTLFREALIPVFFSH